MAEVRAVLKRDRGTSNSFGVPYDRPDVDEDGPDEDDLVQYGEETWEVRSELAAELMKSRYSNTWSRRDLEELSLLRSRRRGCCSCSTGAGSWRTSE